MVGVVLLNRTTTVEDMSKNSTAIIWKHRCVWYLHAISYSFCHNALSAFFDLIV